MPRERPKKCQKRQKKKKKKLDNPTGKSLAHTDDVNMLRTKQDNSTLCTGISTRKRKGAHQQFLSFDNLIKIYVSRKFEQIF